MHTTTQPHDNKIDFIMITKKDPDLIDLVAFKGRICSDPKCITYYNYNFKLFLIF